MDMLIFNLPQPAKVKTPVLVLGAERDGLFTPAEAQKRAEAYGSKTIMLPNAHQAMLETNWRDSAEIIISWIQQRLA